MSQNEGPQERRFDYARTVALSDGVFAIALTLLVLNITAPVLASDQHNLLGHQLLDNEHRDQYISYAIGFAVIAFLWTRHHAFFRGVDHIDTRLTVLNLVYLGFVAFMPFPTRVLGLYSDQPAAVVMYAATAVAVSLLAGATRVHAARAGLLSEAGRRQVEQREHWLIVPAVFLLSIPIAFASTTAALWSWLLVAVLSRLHRQLSRS
jgi:uncharacterized membrane protein